MSDEFQAPTLHIYCELIVEGKTQLEAFKGAGGESTSSNRKAWEKAAHRFSKKQIVRDKIAEMVQERAIDTQISLVNLAPLAVSHMKDVLTSDDPKDKRAKDKVAENVMLRVKEILPKEVRVKHEHGIKEIDLDALVTQLIGAMPEGEAAKLIEGEVEEESGDGSRATIRIGDPEV